MGYNRIFLRYCVFFTHSFSVPDERVPWRYLTHVCCYKTAVTAFARVLHLRCAVKLFCVSACDMTNSESSRLLNCRCPHMSIRNNKQLTTTTPREQQSCEWQMTAVFDWGWQETALDKYTADCRVTTASTLLPLCGHSFTCGLLQEGLRQALAPWLMAIGG